MNCGWGWEVMPVALSDPDEPTKLEEIECIEHAKVKNERLTVHLDNTKKAHSLMHGHCNKAMKT